MDKVAFRAVLTTVGLLSVSLLTACGNSETTTVIREAPAETIERTTTVEAPAPKASAEQASAPKQEPPNVLGLPLPAAERMLKVRENYSICRQGKPRGDLVVVLAQKYGC